MGKRIGLDEIKDYGTAIRYAEQKGYSIIQGGPHAKVKDGNGHMAVIPRHRGDIPRGTLRSIVKMLAAMSPVVLFVLWRLVTMS
jgi:predicted RNA binding protein YcfA (HicA-like mRNA interferase family)